MKKITFFLVLISYVSLAQEYAYIDFGVDTNTTPGNWNNVAIVNAADATGISLGLIDSNGTSTGVTLTIDDAFDTVNTAGTTSPDVSLPFPSSATADSFFGETSTFNGTLEPTGGFILTGLNPAKYYSFSIFASRNTSENREAQYTLVGLTTQVVTLNPSNNVSQTADVLDLQPNASGEITLTAEPGPNNANSTGFYYLGAIEMITSDSPLSATAFKLKEMLNIYPNPVSEVFDVKLNLREDSKVKIEIYDINGRLVSNLFEGQQPAGDFQFNWERGSNGKALSTGSYFLKISVNDQIQTKKLIIK